MFPFSASKVKSSRVTAPLARETVSSGVEESSGIFDPVPALSTIGVCGGCPAPAHDLEARVQRRLLGEPGLHFTNLTVRRLRNGAVCLEGVLSTTGYTPSLSTLLAEVEGVEDVVDHVLVCQGDDC